MRSNISNDKFIEAVNKSATLAEAATRLGITASTVSHRLRRYPELKEQLTPKMQKQIKGPRVSDDEIVDAVNTTVTYQKAADKLNVSRPVIVRRLKMKPELRTRIIRDLYSREPRISDEEIVAAANQSATLAEAAERLGVTPVTVSRRIRTAQLEAQLEPWIRKRLHTYTWGTTDDEIVDAINSTVTHAEAAAKLNVCVATLGLRLRTKPELRTRIIPRKKRFKTPRLSDEELLEVVNSSSTATEAATKAGCTTAEVRQRMRKPGVRERVTTKIRPWRGSDAEEVLEAFSKSKTQQAAADILGITSGALSHKLSRHPELKAKVAVIRQNTDNTRHLS